MMVKVMSLSFNTMLEEFDDTELCEFLKQFSVFDVRDYFFMKNEVPYLAFIIKYLPHRSESKLKAQTQVATQAIEKAGRHSEEWRKELTEADMGLFHILKKWRYDRSKKEGVPPYILLTNKELAAVVKAKPQSLGELEKINGIGKGKMEKYGEDILAITKVDTGSDPVPSGDGVLS